MVDRIDKMEYAKAIGRLYEFCSIRKFHLIEKKFIDDEIGVLARNINDDIKEQTGLNIFNATDDTDLHEYEKQLNIYNLNFVRTNLKYSIIGDDFEFLKKIQEYPIDKIINKKIDVQENVKYLIKQHFKITVPSLNAYLKSPSFVELFHGETALFFIVNVLVKVSHKEKILMLIITPKSEVLFSTRYSAGGPRPLEIKDELTVHEAYLFKKELFENYFHSPSRLLLKLIEYYGVILNLGGLNKKLLVDEYADMTHIKDLQHLDEYLYSQSLIPKGHQLAGGLAGHKGALADKVTGYYIDLTKFLNDLNAGRV